MDNWYWVWLMMIGLLLWLVMIVLLGLLWIGGYLVVVWIGVGIGEVIVSLLVYLLIFDYFLKWLCVIVLLIYFVGLYVGGGCLLFIGGLIV